MNTRLLITLAGVSFLVVGSGGSVCYAEEVTVQLKNGRKVSGEVDFRTSDELLWLRISDPGIVLRSAFAWQQVDSVLHRGQKLSAKEFGARTPHLKSKLPENFFSTNRQPVVVRPDADLSQIPSANQQAGQAGRPLDGDQQSYSNRRVQSLHIEAVVANWDGDVETDGLRIFVYPLDAVGRVVPVNANLRLKLFGQRFAPTTARRWRRNQPFPELETWSVRVRKSDFDEERGAVYDLRFRRFHPEIDVDIAPDALLNARLSVPGNGSFDASDANVNLRPLSQFRDELQLGTGRRFLRREYTRRFGR